MNSIETPRLTDTHRSKIRRNKAIVDLVSHPDIQAVIKTILDKPTDRQREMALTDAMRRVSFRQLYFMLRDIAEEQE